MSPIALIGHRPDDQRHPLHFLQRRVICACPNQLTMAPQLSQIEPRPPSAPPAPNFTFCASIASAKPFGSAFRIRLFQESRSFCRDRLVVPAFCCKRVRDPLLNAAGRLFPVFIEAGFPRRFFSQYRSLSSSAITGAMSGGTGFQTPQSSPQEQPQQACAGGPPIEN